MRNWAETSWHRRKWVRVRFDASFVLNLVSEMRRDWWCCSGSMPDGWHFPFGDHIDCAKIWRALSDVRGYIWTFDSPGRRKPRNKNQKLRLKKWLVWIQEFTRQTLLWMLVHQSPASLLWIQKQNQWPPLPHQHRSGWHHCTLPVKEFCSQNRSS